VDIYDDVKLNATQHIYKSHPNYSISDHKPVTGEFDIAVKINVRCTHRVVFHAHATNDNIAFRSDPT
jgi:hypothetical protein